MRTSDQTDALYPAVFKAQQSMGKLVKDAKNPHFKSTYATLGAVQDVAIPAFEEQGVSVIQSASGSAGSISITTRLVHVESGQWLESELTLPLAKATAQEAGSAITYGRRYSLQTIAGLNAEDDDGNAASASKPRASNEKPKPASTQQKQEIEEAFDKLRQSDPEVQANGLKFVGATDVNSLTEAQAESLMTVLKRKLNPKTNA